jgi:peptidoglycan/xylan/chitin deacetylase (PgdA/CDA1 family)
MKLKIWRTAGKLASKIGISNLITGESDVILMFHHVGGSEGEISPESFEKVISFLEKEFEIVGIDDVFQSSEKRKVAITFDDGYQNFYKNAYPLLREKEIPFTVFLNSEFLTDDGRSYPEQLGNEEKIVTVEQTKKLSQDEKVTIGNHGKGHADLTELDEKELKEEIIGSKRNLEDQLDIEIDTFCYPYGKYNDSAVRVASKVHKYCFTVDRGFVDPETTQRSKIPRIDGAQDFKVLKWELTSVAEKIFSKMDETRY